MRDTERGRPLVYICSRYSGDTGTNTEKAREYSRFATERGMVPLAPHLLLPQFINEETERETAMKLDMEFLKRCDAVWVFGVENGISDGMAAEIAGAVTYGLDIRYFNEQREELFI